MGPIGLVPLSRLRTCGLFALALLGCDRGAGRKVSSPPDSTAPSYRTTSSVLAPATAAILSLTAAAAAAWALKGVRRRVPGTVRLGLAAAWLLSAAALGLSIRAFPWDSLDPELSAYASSVVGVLGFQWLVLLVLLVTAMIGLLWAFGRPDDRRGHLVAYNTGLVATFAGVSAVVVLAVVYLSPRLW